MDVSSPVVPLNVRVSICGRAIFFFKAVEIIASETHYRLTYPVSDAEWLIRRRGGNFTLHVSLLN